MYKRYVIMDKLRIRLGLVRPLGCKSRVQIDVTIEELLWQLVAMFAARVHRLDILCLTLTCAISVVSFQTFRPFARL